jgi:hypothetical protein
MSRLRNLVKGNPLLTQPGKCICGVRLKSGQCSHCDNVCDRILRNPIGCKRCAKNVTNFLHKDHIRQQYFFIIDEDVEKASARIRLQSLRNDYPDFLRPDGGEPNE